MTINSWRPLEGNSAEMRKQCDRPLEALADGSVPAVVFRNAWPAGEAAALVDRLTSEGLLHSPHAPVTEEVRGQAIPEGYYREGANSAPKQAWTPVQQAGRMRIDIGTSLGYRGSNQDAFFEHSKESHQLFNRLFAEHPNPIQLLYDRLQSLAPHQQVRTAREKDGREYGPAIVRAHYGGYAYKPHFDSVRLREKRSGYAVHEFEHQFAGVLVLQNTVLDEKSAQGIIHQCLWNEDIAPFLKADKFHDFAAEQNIENVRVELKPGDLYFFNTRLIHEVPGVAGDLPRVVLAVFIGFTPDREEIFVWA
jgi:hypothetical protein